jgi:hypothetical protein
MLFIPAGVFADVEIKPHVTGTVWDSGPDGVFDQVSATGGYPIAGFDLSGAPEQPHERRGIWEFPLWAISPSQCIVSATFQVPVTGYTQGPNTDYPTVRHWELHLTPGDGAITVSDADVDQLQSMMDFSTEEKMWDAPVSFSINPGDLQELVDSGAPFASLMLRSTTSVAGKNLITVFSNDARLNVSTSESCSELPTDFGGVVFPQGPVSFADKVVSYDPGYGGGPEPDVTQQDARQILGVPKQGSMSLGNGGQMVVRFMDNKLVPSGDSRPDLYIYEVGGAETTRVEIKGNTGPWYSVGTATGYASGIDIDAYGFGRGDSFMFVRLTDDGDSYSDNVTPGADLVAVGARTTIRSRRQEEYLTYWIQAHVGGRSQLIIRENTLSWHHFKGTAPGQTRASAGFASGASSPTIIDSSQGPNIEWVHNDWPERLSNGTHPESWAHFDLLTPVFPKDGWCWKAKQLSGVAPVNINAQPNSINGYALKIMFNDLGSGNNEYLSGSGYYSIQLTNEPC